MPFLTPFRCEAGSLFATEFKEDGAGRPRANLAILSAAVLLALAISVIAQQNQTGQVVTLSAADYQPKIAPEAIVATFGNGLATGTQVADTLPLPTELGGTTVTIRDAQGREMRAPLLFVSPTQINHLIPAEAVSGPAEITVRAGNGAVSAGTIQVAAIAPAIFTANQDGRGVPAAIVLRQSDGGVQSFESPSSFVDGRFIARAIDLGPEGERVFLILFLSGLRRAPDSDGNAGNGAAESVSVQLGGEPQSPLFAGAQGSFAGLDQINVEIGRDLLEATLPGSKQISISVKVAGFPDSNEVEISLAPPSAPPLEVTGFNAPAQLLANSEIQIQGSGLSPVTANNRVSFGEGTGDARPGEVRSATSQQVSVIVPFGAASGRIALNSDGKRWTSEQELQVRTSFSAQIKDTDSQPISAVLGARVCSPTCAAGNPSTNVQTGGWFVLPDPPAGSRRLFTIEPPSTGGALPFNRTTVAAPILAGRDNHLPQEIYLQTIFGPSGTVGPGGGLAAPAAAAPPLDLSIEGFRFTLPGDASAAFPDGARTGVLTLTPVKNSLTPVPMPPNVFSSSVVQISPFGVKLEPGGKLIFPDRDGLGGGPLPTLYRYDLDSAAFIDTGIKVTLGVDGTFQTPEGAITETSIYFIAVRRDSTTIVGRVLDADGRTPVRGAVVSTRGQQTTSDGNGGYILQGVPVGEGAAALAQANRGARRARRNRAVDELTITSSYLRPSGKTDTATISVGEIDIGGVTRVPSLVLPPVESNRPPVIYAPGYLTLYVDETREAAITIDDPDPNQSIASAAVSGADFASLAGSSPGSYLLRLAPKAGDAGAHLLTIMASDSAGASASLALTVVVLPLPLADALAITTNEDTPASFTLGGSASGGALTFALVEGPMRGALSGELPALTYTPNANYNGMDSFRFRVSDGTATSAPATVSITINPVNDPPQLTINCARSTILPPGTALECTLLAADVDEGQVLSFSAQGLPSGATFDPVSAQFNWTPGPGQSGSFIVAFSVTDNGAPALSHQQSLEISVFNAVPVISGFQPLMATVSPDPLQITVTGENFVVGSEARWNGSARPTMFVSANELVVTIPASDLAATGTAQVTVFNPQPGGGVSAPVNYSIVNPMPLLDTFLTVTPTFNFLFQEAGMVLVGAGFLPTSVARWDGVDRPTIYISPTQLGFVAPIIPLAEAPNTHSITVFNPGPGGGVSNPITGFAIPNNQPTIDFTNPTMVDAGGGDFAITITGSFFVPGAVANWNGSPRPTSGVTLLNAGLFTELTVTIPASDIAMGGVAMLTVTNPAPLSNTSAPFAFPVNHPAPTLTTYFPPASPYDFFFGPVVVLEGTGFTPTSVIRWDGVDVPTTFITSINMQFTAPPISPADPFSPHEITVFTPAPGGGLSNTLVVPGLNNVAPSISQTSLPYVTAGGQEFIIGVLGSFFTPGSELNWNGSPRPTIVQSSFQLFATISAADTAEEGTAMLTVSNPAPFNTISAAFPFTIHPAPTISSLGPDGITLLTPGEPADVLVVGSNFLSDTIVYFDGVPLPTTFLDSTTLRFDRPAITFDLNAAGTYDVQVINPGPNPGLSAPVVFTVFNPAPQINNLSPQSATAGDPAFTLRVNGQKFLPSSVVRWNGEARATTYVNENALDADIPASDLMFQGMATVTVFTPGPGGGESNGVVFDIFGGPFTSLIPRGPAVARLASGEALLAGGREEKEDGSIGPPTKRVEIFDPASQTSRAVSSMIAARAGHTATMLASGEVLVVGGLGASGRPETSAEIYDPMRGEWRRARAPHFAHIGHTSTLLADGRVLVAGGLTIDNQSESLTGSAEIYNPATGLWAPAGALKVARAAATAALLADGRVLVAGGTGAGGVLASVEAFDPQTGEWRSTGEMYFARRGQTMTRLWDGRLLVAGGAGEEAASVAEIYDPATGEWRIAGRLATPRRAHSALLMFDGRVLLSGGESEEEHVLRECEIFDPLSGASASTVDLPQARAGHTAILLPDGRVLALGGYGEKKGKINNRRN